MTDLTVNIDKIINAPIEKVFDFGMIPLFRDALY